MTDQEIFDKAVLGVVAQGGPSVLKVPATHEDEYDPANLGEHGRRSTTGHVLPDALIQRHPHFGVYHIYREGELPTEFHGQYGLLRALEKAHDKGFDGFIIDHDGNYPDGDQHFLDVFLDRCEAIAAEYGLKMPNIPFGQAEGIAA